MADTSGIDLVALIEQNTPTRFAKAAGVGTKRTQKGQCPFCGLGTDRFAVFVNEMPQHYHCGIHGNGCGAHGDAVTFARKWFHWEDGPGYYSACEFLSIDPGSEYSGPSHRQGKDEDKPPVEEWQKKAQAFCETCKKVLWSDTGKNAVAYLKKRGFTEDALKAAGIGYNPKTVWEEVEAWAVTDKDIKAVWLPRGIVIPWLCEGQLWKVSIRRPDPDLAAQALKWEAEGRAGKPPKYIAITGGGNGLYGVDEIRDGQPLVVCEGEFDRLIFKQATKNRVASVATGSTGKGREEKWTCAIGQASQVLVAFDYDESGNKAAGDYWGKVLDKAIRWSPWAHDLNQMHQDGMDLNEWLDAGIEVAGLPPIVVPAVLKTVQLDTQPLVPAVAVTPIHHQFTQGPYIDKDGVARSYSVTYLSYHPEPDVCFSPYFEAIIDAETEFEADSGLTSFELWDTAKNVLVATFRKWRVEETVRPASLVHVSMSNKPAPGLSARPVNRKNSIPTWAIPGTHEWKKQVERNGLQATQEVREAWLAAAAGE